MICFLLNSRRASLGWRNLADTVSCPSGSARIRKQDESENDRIPDVGSHSCLVSLGNPEDGDGRKATKNWVRKRLVIKCLRDKRTGPELEKDFLPWQILWRSPSSKVQQQIDSWFEPVTIHKFSERKFLREDSMSAFVPFVLGDRRRQVIGRSKQKTCFFKGLSDARYLK